MAWGLGPRVQGDGGGRCRLGGAGNQQRGKAQLVLLAAALGFRG